MRLTVRQATTDDVPWLLGQLAQFDRFIGAKHSLFPSPDYAERMLTELLASQPFLVAVGEDGPVGFIAGALAPHPYNPAIRVLTELFWWVAEPYRRSRAGLLLLNAFVRIGEEQADWIFLSLEHASPVNETTLTRRGFRPFETTYLLEVA